ncbi:DUF1330 domain-containing protein [Thermaurantiacus tibetensis]|uniref:DUF1330 domain-containing protein n=1 Tax=Thermaurantiacus tibetensis TaxID=2759035 RepID=UPI0018909333|nr:DUF1330 domain-containing protein [Thermaurantiacus tibetensis]
MGDASLGWGKGRAGPARRLVPSVLLALAALPGLPALAAEPPPRDVPSPVAGQPTLDPERCDGRPVLMIVRGLLADRERLARYAEALRASGLYPALDGYYLNDPRRVDVFEGDPPANESILVVRFPCLAHARAFWYSREYQERIRPLRLDPPAGSFTVTVHPELPPPPYMAGRVQPPAYASTPGPEVAAAIPQVPR